MQERAQRFNSPEALRYRRFRLYSETLGFRISDLYAAFSATEIEGQRKPIHRSVFYRVCRGQKRSQRIQKWLSKTLRVPMTELWGVSK